MTKRELIEMVKNFNDNDEIIFVERTTDRDGYPEDTEKIVHRIVKKGTKKVRQIYVNED
jgi:hypothetical protein